MRRSERFVPRVPGGLGFPLGVAVCVVVTLVAVAAGATVDPLRSLIPLTVVVAATAILSTLVAAVGTAAVAWAMYDGFVIDRAGQLTFSARSLVALAVLMGAAVVLAVVTSAVRNLWARHIAARAVIPMPRAAIEPVAPMRRTAG